MGLKNLTKFFIKKKKKNLGWGVTTTYQLIHNYYLKFKEIGYLFHGIIGIRE